VNGVAARGRRGEDAACRHLEGQGLRVVARNFTCRLGEIDVVAQDGATTVFVEVKERGDASRGAGFESVTLAKRRRVIAAARLYAARHGLGETPCRFDVISIDRSAGLEVVRHDRGAFDVDGG
jgi:putative endonuclease